MKERGLDDVLCGDIRGLEISDKFDTIYLLMNGIGMAGRISEMGSFLDLLGRLIKPGGKIIADSSDLIYLYEENDGSYSIPMHRYYGEMDFEVRFDGSKESFPWIYIDPETMEDLAVANGWEMTILEEGDHYDYLFELRKSD